MTEWLLLLDDSEQYTGCNTANTTMAKGAASKKESEPTSIQSPLGRNTRASAQASRTLRSNRKRKRSAAGDDQDSVGSGSSASTYNPLPRWTKKQLAQDLEEAGGLCGFDREDPSIERYL